MIKAADLLGVGLYSPPEAALYARVSTRLMRRWVYGNRQGESVIEPQLGLSEEKTVTFLDFVQALAVRRIRNDHHISLQTIREAYLRARTEFGIRYPFALESSRIGLFGPPNNPARQVIFICVNKGDEETQQYFQLTGKKHGNQLIKEVVRTYSYRLTYDPASKLACRYTAFEALGEQVTMDPAIKFGEPVVMSSGYAAATLYDAYLAEGSVERAADIYKVPQQQIAAAIEYFDFINPVLRDTADPVPV